MVGAGVTVGNDDDDDGRRLEKGIRALHNGDSRVGWWVGRLKKGKRPVHHTHTHTHTHPRANRPVESRDWLVVTARTIIAHNSERATLFRSLHRIVVVCGIGHCAACTFSV